MEKMEEKRYKDEEIREIVGIGVNALKRIRIILKEKGLLLERERISTKNLEIIKEAAKIRKLSNTTYEEALSNVLSKNQAEECIERIFEENEDTKALLYFQKVVEKQYDNGDKMVEEFFNHFNSITDMLRKIGDKSDVSILMALQETIVNNVAYKYCIDHGIIS